MARVASEIADLVRRGVQVRLVIGGGNIFRGAGLAGGGFGSCHRRPYRHAGNGNELAGDAGRPEIWGVDARPIGIPYRSGV